MVARAKPEGQRRNLSATRTTKRAPSGAKSKAPRAPSGLHPEALRWYRSLAESGQSTFYEPSDWTMAAVGARLLSDWMENRSAASINGWQKICDRLLSSESSRRQALIELNRIQAKDPATKPASERKRSLGIVK